MSVTSFGSPSSGPTQGGPDNASKTRMVATLSPTSKYTRLFAIARIGHARQALADILVSYARLLQSNDDANSRTQLRTELAGLLIDKDPELLDCVIEIAGRKRKATGPRLLELFEDLIAIARRYEAAGIAESDPAWSDLHAMSERLLNTYRQRVEEILPQLKMEGTTLKIVPQWLVVAATALKSDSAAARLPGLLVQSPGYMLDSTGFSVSVDALDELVVAGMEAEAEALTKHLCSALKTYSKEDRVKAVAGLALLVENSMDQSSKTVMRIEDALLEGCARETSESVLRTFLAYLLERTVALFNHSYFPRAERHADTVGTLDRSFRKAMGEDAPNPVRDAVAELSKSAWAQGLVGHLLDGGDKEQSAAKILSVIDRNLATTLIAQISREDNLPRAQVYARHLKQLCPGSAKMFVALMSSQNDPAMLSRMLAIASHVGGDDEILEVVYPLLIHPNFDLRATALQYILDRDTEHTAAFVASRLRDPRCGPQREMWMGILTKLRHPAAAQIITAELQAEIDSPLPDDRRTMALIEACSGHDDVRMASALVRLLRAGAGLNETRRITAIQRDNAKAIKLAAMKVLMRYTRDPRVYETLDRMRKDTDPDISRMAAYCLSPQPDLAARPQTQMLQGTRSVATAATPPATQTHSAEQLKARRGFEELEQPSEEILFKPGTAITGKHSRLQAQQSQTSLPPLPPNDGSIQFSGKQTVLDPSQLPDDLFAGLKPLLEGELTDLGLGLTARITCAKNGVMIIKCALGNGAIYIQNKVVVAAFFSGMSDIQALSAIGKLKQANFAYYAKTFSYAATMSVEVSNIETAIREYLDMR